MKIGDLIKKKKVDMPSKILAPARRPVALPAKPVGSSFGKTTPAFALSERIGNLSRQGLSEPEIVKELRGQGYSSLDIDKALRDSLKTGVGEPVLPVMERSVRETRTPPKIDFERDDLRMPEFPAPQRQPSSLPPRQFPPRPQPTGRPFPVMDLRKGTPQRQTEELIEVTVEEKWKEAENKIKNMESKLGDLDASLKKLEEDITGLKQMEEKKGGEISGKIDTYKDSITELAERLEGMETALKSALESVLESNRSLSDAVRGLKEKGR